MIRTGVTAVIALVVLLVNVACDETQSGLTKRLRRGSGGGRAGATQVLRGLQAPVSTGTGTSSAGVALVSSLAGCSSEAPSPASFVDEQSARASDRPCGRGRVETSEILSSVHAGIRGCSTSDDERVAARAEGDASAVRRQRKVGDVGQATSALANLPMGLDR